ncbi:uncharacterized protein K02A2.6-like, partial [Drosophila obscura]|uniref:uncharacterized protein K02A2.6-like n=1 Tax=Drosophila obscura TaxID=7282 RepID=UPI001BB24D62
MLALGVIEESVVFSCRDCILSRLPKAQFISSIDLKDAYWQISLTPRAREKTAFTVPGRPLYQFTVMPFGLSNAPQTMSKLMDKVIPPSLRNEIFIYLDDLLVISESFEKHISVLKVLANRLSLAGLTINVEKSKFCLKEVKYLGHVIGYGTIQTDPEKVEAIRNFPVPRSVKQVRRFLGTTGSQNIVPDALSRVHTEDLSALSCDGLVDLHSAHFKSADYLDLIRKIESNQTQMPDIRIIDKLIYRRAEHAAGEQIADDSCWKLWIPKELVSEVLKQHHEPALSAHSGINKTLEKIRRYYYWPNLATDVRAFINGCSICKCTKHPNRSLRPPLAPVKETQRVFQKLFVDFLGPYPRSKSGHIGIFVVLDHLSKYPFLKPVKKFTADAVTRFMEDDIFHCFGVPEVIVSDNGVQFKSHHFNALLKKYNVQHFYTAVYAPQANASERVNRSVIAAIKAYIKPDQSNWDEQLSPICCALRSSVHSAVNDSPYRVAFGQHMITNGDTYPLLRNLQLLEDRT